MNSQAAFETITRPKLSDMSQGARALLGTIADFVAKAVRESKAASNSQPYRAISGYRLGDSVRHASLGSGRVMAHWPDGTLLVRFDGDVKSRLVWPSFLIRADGQGDA